MITSMTGFGRSKKSADGIKVICETRTVNSRYLDFNIRIPQIFQEKQLELKELLQEYIERGNVKVHVKIDESGRGIPDVTFDQELIQGYAALLKEMKVAAGIDAEITLGDLLSFEDIFQSREEDEETIEVIFQLIKEALEESLQNLNRMRQNEGGQLENDLRLRLGIIEEIIENIEEKCEGRIQTYRDKLKERITMLLDDEDVDVDVDVDEGRLEQEIAITADKIDVTEELVRLKSHIKFFYEALDSEQSVGRRLNFLLQEMNREINTIGSKANNSKISQLAVAIKENLEKLKEQVQNIE